MTLMHNLIAAARNEARFLRTRAELSRLTQHVRDDLNITDIDAAARRAVWG
jgi:uncharacterized protein YjiS (DUF1127 family)